MADKFTKDTDKRFTLRMNKELYERISESAKDNKRSVAKEIEYVIEQFLKRQTK